MKAFCLILLSCVFGLQTNGATLISEDYESLQPGDQEPNFDGIGSNYPPAVIQVASDTVGAEFFRPGNTRFLDWESLSGINPDSVGFNGGPSAFNAFPGGAASVVSFGFDFRLEGNHGELLFGVGQVQTSRTDDQNFGVRVVIRGALGIHGTPEIATTFPGDFGDQGLKNGVPYRVEVVANKSGAPIDYLSPIGPMRVENERFDLFLMNIETGVYQLVFDDSSWHNAGMALEGFWWATYPYTSTGRAVDIKLDNIAVYQNEIVLTGYDAVRPGPASAYIDFENVRPGSNRPEALWYLPGQLVKEPQTGGTFGASNSYYWDTNGASLPSSWTDEYRFNGAQKLLSIGFDVYVDRDEVITSFSDAHDEVFLAFSGGDTRANAAFTSIVKIRGTRSVGNDGNPAEAEPTLQITGATSATRGVGFDWSTPYRIQILLNQSGNARSYDTPWASGVTLANETVHLYLYNYLTGENLKGDGGTPYYLEADFLNGIANTEGVKGTLYDCIWKTVTGRRIDLRLDNIAVLEGVLSVTYPEPEAGQATILDLGFYSQAGNAYQLDGRKYMRLQFEAVPGTAYGMLASPDLLQFTDLNTFIPGSYAGQPTLVEIPMETDTRFIVLKRISR